MKELRRIILGRLIGLLFVLLGVSLLVFLATELLPGDVALFMLGEKATDAQIEALREQLRLNDPLPLRYVRWMAGALQGDLGETRMGRSVARDIAERFPATLELTLCGLLVAIVLGVTSGSLAAMSRGTWMDRSLMTAALLGVSVPVFWLALELLQLFAVHWPLFPLTGRLPVGVSVKSLSGLLLLDTLLQGRPDLFSSALRHLALPSLTLGLVSSSILARMTRSGLVDESGKEYLLAAKARGLGPGRIYLHAFRGAMMPVLTVMGLEFGALLGGAVITETIFVWPGIGTYLVNAILARDIPAVQGAALTGAAAFVLVNFLVDLLYAAIDPRVRHG